MRLESDAFEPGGELPVRYARDGEQISPPLSWSDVPERARELALVFENVTEPWVQWVVYGIPANREGLSEGLRHARSPEGSEALQGTNSQGNVGYDAPLGTEGRKYSYAFRLHALDVPLDAPPGLTREQLERRMEGHVIDTADLEAVYQRPGE